MNILFIGAGIVALIVAFLALWWRRWSVVLIASSFALLAFAYPLLSAHFYEQKFRFAQNYVKQVGPTLEEFRHIHGSYPKELSELVALPPCPHGLEYVLRDNAYEFIYYDPQSIIDYHAYFSSEGKWTWDN